MNIIMLGAPGSGKGTQAQNLQERLHIPAISTGAILREAIKNETSVGLKAKGYIDAGHLVPDDVMVELLRGRIAEENAGFILDGFPRTIAQAQALENIGVAIDLVLSLEVDDAEIEKRISGRRVCDGCGLSYHTQFNAPKREGVCDACGGELIQRVDDKPETVRARLEVYHSETEPLKGYYQRTGKLKTVVSHEDLEVTTRRTLEALGI